MRADLFEVHPLGDDPFVLVAAVGRRERRLADLVGVRVLGSRGCVLQDLVGQHLAAAGVDAEAYDLFDDNGMVQELAAAGEGVAVVPRLTVDLDDPRVRVHDVSRSCPRGPSPPWSTGSATSARPPPASSTPPSPAPRCSPPEREHEQAAVQDVRLCQTGRPPT